MLESMHYLYPKEDPGLTATVAKTSAGAIEHVPVARVPNIPQVVENKRGYMDSRGRYGWRNRAF